MTAPEIKWSAAAEAAARAAHRTNSFIGRAAPVIGAAIPVALVNATAFIGQFAWVRQHVPWILPGQVLFAVALESVAIYLAWHAHLAQLANDSAGRLKLGAYLFALVIGAMNYSHYATDWHPNALAVGLGMMSAISPWLWGIHSRRASRDRLMERGLVEEHAVRLGANRWMWHVARSAQVMYHATWDGESNPQRAIALYEDRKAARRADRLARKAVPSLIQPAAVPAVQASAPLQAAQDGPAAIAPAPAGPAVQDAPAGRPVLAIAALSAQPSMRAVHEISPERWAEAELHLAGLSVADLPSDRKVGEMLCTEHNHRRQGARLLAERREAGADPVPAFARRPAQVNGSTLIASPVATLPGGASAHG